MEASLAQNLQDAQFTPEARLAISDISERKLAEADEIERGADKREQAVLAKADAERRFLLDNIQIQVWYMTDDHTYGRVNAAHAAKLLCPVETHVSKKKHYPVNQCR